MTINKGWVPNSRTVRLKSNIIWQEPEWMGQSVWMRSGIQTPPPLWSKENRSLLYLRKFQRQGVQRTTPHTCPTRGSWRALPGYLPPSYCLDCCGPGAQILTQEKDIVSGKTETSGWTINVQFTMREKWEDWRGEGRHGGVRWWYVGALLMGRPHLRGIATKRWLKILKNEIFRIINTQKSMSKYLYLTNTQKICQIIKKLFPDVFKRHSLHQWALIALID